MLTLNEMIEYENENTNLDFKREEYAKEKYNDLIKDVMSMANSPTNQPKYIIIGIKVNSDGNKNFIGLDSLTDQANLENVIQENIEPLIHFNYYPHTYKDKMFGVIEIDDNTNQPYMMKKDYKKLYKGDIWVRKGSRQSKATREDLNRMNSFIQENKFNGNIKVGFGEKIEKEFELIVPSISKENSPSFIARRSYEEKLATLRGYLKTDNVPDEEQSLSLSKMLNGYRNPFSDYNVEKKAIRIGYDQYGLYPIYATEEELLEKIDNVEQSFGEEDYYYLFEENSLKLNFCILNNGNSFLEDVSIKFHFDREVFSVAEEIPEKPMTQMEKLRQGAIDYSFLPIGYPTVTVDEESISVEEHYSAIRHKELYEVFDEDLRVLVRREKVGGTYKIPYKISARNLYHPISNELTLVLLSE